MIKVDFFKKHINTIICSLSLLFIGVYLFSYFQYAVVSYDDIPDFCSRYFTIHHGRFITDSFERFIMYLLPQYLNIHFQDFAVFSEGLVKVFGILFLIHIASLSFFQHKKTNIFMIILYMFFLLYIPCVVHYIDGTLLFRTNDWFFAHFLPVPFFILFAYQIRKYFFSKDSSNNKIIKTKLNLCILAFIMPSLSEMLGFCSLIMMLLLHRKKTPLIFPVCLNLLMFLFSYLYGCFSNVFNEKKVYLFDIFSLNNFIEYIKTCYKVLIADNWFVLIVLFIGICFLIYKRNKENIQQELIFIFYVIISLFTFFVFLYFMGDTNNYGSHFKNVKLYWCTYFGILFPYKIILVCLVLYIADTISKLIGKKNILLYTAVLIFLPACILPIRNYYNSIIDVDISYKESLYKMDKMAVFYFKQGKTAILSRKNVYNLFAYITMPGDLEKENPSQEIYYQSRVKTKRLEDNIYLEYIKQTYHVGVPDGMSFRNEGDAIRIFYENGGYFTKAELKKLKFGDIYKTSPLYKELIYAVLEREGISESDINEIFEIIVAKRNNNNLLKNQS